jgi:hypothetical protein
MVHELGKCGLAAMIGLLSPSFSYANGPATIPEAKEPRDKFERDVLGKVRDNFSATVQFIVVNKKTNGILPGHFLSGFSDIAVTGEKLPNGRGFIMSRSSVPVTVDYSCGSKEEAAQKILDFIEENGNSEFNLKSKDVYIMVDLWAHSGFNIYNKNVLEQPSPFLQLAGDKDLNKQLSGIIRKLRDGLSFDYMDYGMDNPQWGSNDLPKTGKGEHRGTCKTQGTGPKIKL